MSKVFLVTGASRGIGRALCEELVRRGHQVYGGARSWPAGESLPFTALDLDVGSDQSVADAVTAVEKSAGRLDVLVNNAGISHSGAVEDVPMELARKVMETNYLGLVRMIRAALPLLRASRGDLINVGSAAGKIGVPFQAHYAASKFAVEGLSESLCHELRPFGVRVILIQPGDVGTTIWKRSEHVMPESSPYRKMMESYHAVKAKEMEKKPDTAENVARQIADIILSPTNRLRHPVAKGTGLIMAARKILPDSLFLRIVATNYRMKK